MRQVDPFRLPRPQGGSDSPHRLAWKLALAGVAASAACAVSAGLLTGAPEGGYPENAAPAPPPLQTSNLLQVALPRSPGVMLGIDPASVSVGSDGIVRYVAVVRSATGSALSASYEAIRCATAEYKLYARHYAEGDWRAVADPQWQSLYSGGQARNALPVARAGVCKEAAANGSREQIVKDLGGNTMNFVAP